ncbi:integrase, catalytic region, zinc finger, CCHC-type containing protein, partial [Tanacetum coccineum]
MRDKEMQKNLALLAKYFKKLYKPTNNNLRTSSNSRNKTEDTTPRKLQCFNCKGFGHYAKECKKPKRVKDYSYHKEKMMMCKQAEQGVPLQADWLEDTDEEIDEPESINDTYVDQNAVECVDERAALANLIANLKLDVDENKKIQKQLKKTNASLTQELKECKSTLVETSRTLGESN